MLREATPALHNSGQNLTSTPMRTTPIAALLGAACLGLSCTHLPEGTIAHEHFLEYKATAERDGAIAQYKLGNCYSNGHGIPIDSAEAVKWWHKAAKQNLAEAQICMGICYYFGESVPLDY